MHLIVTYFHLFWDQHYSKISYPTHPLCSVFISSCCSSSLPNFDLVIFADPILSIFTWCRCMTCIAIVTRWPVDNAHSSFNTRFAIRCLFCVSSIRALWRRFTSLLCWLSVFCLLAQIRCFSPASIGTVDFVGFKTTSGPITDRVGDYRSSCFSKSASSISFLCFRLFLSSLDICSKIFGTIRNSGSRALLLYSFRY